VPNGEGRGRLAPQSQLRDVFLNWLIEIKCSLYMKLCSRHGEKMLL
jgi:hypothetical protein